MSASTAVAGATTCADVLVRPVQAARLPPCSGGCPGGSDVRQWVGVVAQRAKLGLSKEQAFAHAWSLITEANPFPATLGRICPHPCESSCNRAGKDGAVAINALERFLGDWALQRALPLVPQTPASGKASVGVIGAGPAGLSFAYQMARRGHRVTVYEKRVFAGGMLRYGIPAYRLPKSVLQMEIDRIVALGVALRLNVTVGKDLALGELRARHETLFLGIGAGRAARLDVPGEDGPGVVGGIDFLDRVNRGEATLQVGDVVVIGGGNTAIDAARTARRQGARVTLLYRRTREEMPAIADEVDAALAEGVAIEFLAAPAAVRRVAGLPRAVVAQRMQLGEPDGSGRRRPVPVAGDTFELPAGLVIAAVSQMSDWEGLETLEYAVQGSVAGDAAAALGTEVRAGGDVAGPGIAGVAIAQGRRAAQAAHAMLTGESAPSVSGAAPVGAGDVDPDFSVARPRARPVERSAGERVARPDLEVRGTLDEAAFLEEVERCYSCGQCHGCQHCFMYCNAGGFVRVWRTRPGAYFSLSLERCMGCGKCIELCPTGFLSPDRWEPILGES